MATATERWQKTVSAEEVVAEFDIRGAATHGEALNADAFPRFNDSSVGGGLRAELPRVERQGPASSQLWRGQVRWTVPRFGDSHTDPNPTDPLTEPVVYAWGRGTISAEADISADGYPIVNAAGDAFDPPKSRDLVYWTLEIVKNVEFFDLATLRGYQDVTNRDRLTLVQPNGQTQEVLPGMMHCTEIVPQPYRGDATYVTLAARFQILKHWDFINTANFNDVQLERLSPWHDWRVNEGYNGWFKNDDEEVLQSGPIIGANREPVNMPVRLDVAGKPLGTEFKIQGPGKTEQTPQAFNNFDAPTVDEGHGLDTGPPGSVVVIAKDTKTVLLVYRRCAAKNFLDLNIWT